MEVLSGIDAVKQRIGVFSYNGVQKRLWSLICYDAHENRMPYGCIVVKNELRRGLAGRLPTATAGGFGGLLYSRTETSIVPGMLQRAWASIFRSTLLSVKSCVLFNSNRRPVSKCASSLQVSFASN